MNTDSPLHRYPWAKSARGHAYRTTFVNGWHVSVYRRPGAERLRFRIDGEFPAGCSVKDAIGILWERILRHVSDRRAA